MVVPGEEELGEQALCPDCDEYWPLDEEFFYRDRQRTCGFARRCIDCFQQKYRTPEYKAAQRARATTPERRAHNREYMRRRRARAA